MAFLDEDDILILEKNSGKARLVSDGVLQEDSVLDVAVRTESERGLLGIAVSGTIVFLYYTEEDADEVRNRVYRYNLTGDSLVDETLILDLPGTPGPNHDGGKLAIGPDGMLYAVIGDLNRDGKLQNFPAGADPDDTSVILKVDFDGAPAANVLSGATGLESYYAYGIRNSFGIAFDPVTGTLWNTENGPADYDEINVVEPGFNSGWEQVMGPISRTSVQESDLVAFTGSHYADPVFSWLQTIGVTDVEFFDSAALGAQYANNLFVGDINNGNLYYFEVNDSRDGFKLDNIPEPFKTGLADLVADDLDERNAVRFGTGFGGITDIKTGPDGYLYVLTFGGNIYRIVPISTASEPAGDAVSIADVVVVDINYDRVIASLLAASDNVTGGKLAAPTGGSGGGGTGDGGGSGGGAQPAAFPDSFFANNPLSRIAISSLQVVKPQEANTPQVVVGERVNISTEFKNNQNKVQPYAYIVQVIDREGITTGIDLQLGRLPAVTAITLSVPWDAEDTGVYTVKVLIWDGIVNPDALSEAGVLLLDVRQ